MSNQAAGGPVIDGAEPIDGKAAEAELLEAAGEHGTDATKSATRRLSRLARTNSQIHAEPRPGVPALPHGQSISGRGGASR